MKAFLPGAHIAIDEEASQSRARVIICLVSFVVFSAIGVYQGLDRSVTLIQGLTTIVIYLVFSTVWYTLVRRNPGRWPARRFITLATDLGIMTFFMHLGGGHVASFYPIILWVIIGNGIRFGETILKVGIVIGALGFISLMVWDDFWRANLNVSGGLLAGIIVLPVFFLTVLRRLRQVSELQIKLAESQLAEEAKDQFLATMSHEIRTPMNGVLGMAETLRETRLDDRQREYLHVITRSVESLLNIINDILDYSKITSRKLTLEEIPLDLHQILDDVHQLLSTNTESKGIAFEFDYPEDAPRRFLGDPTRLRQVIFNLVGNAIKFTAVGKVGLTCRVGEFAGDCNIRVTISDTGIGIPADRLAAVFQQFEQADNSTTRQFGGTGLGLAISRKLTVMMGGDIEVESTEGEGSVFTVHLGLKPAPESAPTVSAEPEELPHFGLHALLAEDNKFNQIVLKNLARRIGISVDIAENGQEVLQKIEERDYDLLFMDVRMPVMNGYEAAKAIRARTDRIAALPIIAVTAEATRNDVQLCRDAGMDRHLSKPLSVASLADAIESLAIDAKQPVTS